MALVGREAELARSLDLVLRRAPPIGMAQPEVELSLCIVRHIAPSYCYITPDIEGRPVEQALHNDT